eukprot:gene16527-18205_t
MDSSGNAAEEEDMDSRSSWAEQADEEQPADISERTSKQECQQRGNIVSFAETLKSNSRNENSSLSSRGIKFYTKEQTTHIEIITHIHKWLNNPSAITHLQRMPSKQGHQNWNAVLSTKELVDVLLTKSIFLPSQPEHPLPITSVRSRPTLITIPFASPDISNEQIFQELHQ